MLQAAVTTDKVTTAVTFGMPIGGDPCLNCSEEGPDGKLDLLLKFSRNEVIEFLGEASNGDCVEMTLTGQLVDGTPISVSDHILVKTTTLAEDLGDRIRRIFRR